MADGMIQKTEDRRQKTEVLSRCGRALNKCAAQRHTSICLLSSDKTTGETTSHPTKQPEDGCQVVGYSHSTRLTKNVNQVAGYVFCLLSSVLCPLNAEELTDPTRPPLSITAPTVAGSAEMPPPAGLRSIIISKTRRAAIIDGETVELGGKHGDARLVEVNEAGVVLKGAQGMQVLTLFPDVKMIGRKEMKARQQPAASKVQTGNKPAVRKENE